MKKIRIVSKSGYDGTKKIEVARIEEYTDGTALAFTKSGRKYAVLERDDVGAIWALVRKPRSNPKATRQFSAVKLKTKDKFGPKKARKTRKPNPLGIPTPQGVVLHLVGSKILKRNPKKASPPRDYLVVGHASKGGTPIEEIVRARSAAAARNRARIDGLRHITSVEPYGFAPRKSIATEFGPRKANPARGAGAKLSTPLRKPLVLVLTREESRQVRTGSVAPGLVRKALEAAKASGTKGWDHIEVQHPGGAHAFDLVP